MPINTTISGDKPNTQEQGKTDGITDTMTGRDAYVGERVNDLYNEESLRNKFSEAPAKLQFNGALKMYYIQHVHESNLLDTDELDYFVGKKSIPNALITVQHLNKSKTKQMFKLMITDNNGYMHNLNSIERLTDVYTVASQQI